MPRCSTGNADNLARPRTADLLSFVIQYKTRKDSTKGLYFRKWLSSMKDSSPGVELGLENILCFCQFCDIRTVGLEITMGNNLRETPL